jgi:uncharacterized protein
MSTIDPRLVTIAGQQPYPHVFVTISGAHLYGFPSVDSDYDLRGIHQLPLTELVGLKTGPETLEVSKLESQLQIDLVTHEAGKFLGLLLRRNGYVLEQLCSPLIVQTTLWHDELKQLAPGCITRHHSHHYLGFAKSQWRLFSQTQPTKVKPLLYVYRVLLTGIHLMRTGEIEANLVTLNQTFQLSYLNDLIVAKVSGSEMQILTAVAVEFHQQEYQRLCTLLETASQASHLPDQPTAEPALHDLLLRLRLGETQGC